MWSRIVPARRHRRGAARQRHGIDHDRHAQAGQLDAGFGHRAIVHQGRDGAVHHRERWGGTRPPPVTALTISTRKGTSPAWSTPVRTCLLVWEKARAKCWMVRRWAGTSRSGHHHVDDLDLVQRIGKEQAPPQILRRQNRAARRSPGRWPRCPGCRRCGASGGRPAPRRGPGRGRRGARRAAPAPAPTRPGRAAGWPRYAS